MLRAFFAISMLLATTQALGGGKARISLTSFPDPESSYPTRSERASAVINLFWVEGFPTLKIESQADFLVYLWLSRGSLEPEAVAYLEDPLIRSRCEKRLYGLIDTRDKQTVRGSITTNVERARPRVIAAMKKAMAKPANRWMTMEEPVNLDSFLEGSKRSNTMNLKHPMEALAELRSLDDNHPATASLPIVLPTGGQTDTANSQPLGGGPDSGPISPIGKGLIVLIIAGTVVLGLNVRETPKVACTEARVAATATVASTTAIALQALTEVEPEPTDARRYNESAATAPSVAATVAMEGETIEEAWRRTRKIEAERSAKAQANVVRLLCEQAERRQAIEEQQRRARQLAAATNDIVTFPAYVPSHANEGQLAGV
jgi:hypothetical protein